LFANTAQSLIFDILLVCSECLALVDLLDKTRLKWLATHNENEGLKQLLNANNNEMQALRVKLKLSSEQLRDARAQIASLLSAKTSAEANLAEAERKFDLVRDLLKVQLSLSLCWLLLYCLT
jgi:chromosome segregation ATPase